MGDVIEDNGKTVFENNLNRKHQYALGALVEVRYASYFGESAGRAVHARLYVVDHSRDCDGSPLYTLGAVPPDKWDFEENVHARWKQNRNRLSPFGLLVDSVYKLTYSHDEAALTLCAETPDTKKGAGLPRWEHLDEAAIAAVAKHLWRQQTPFDQLIAILAAISGHAGNVRDDVGDRVENVDRIENFAKQIRELLPFLKRGAWK